MGDKTSLEDRINSNSTHGSYADTYSSLATVQSTQKPTYKLIKWLVFLNSFPYLCLLTNKQNFFSLFFSFVIIQPWLLY